MEYAASSYYKSADDYGEGADFEMVGEGTATLYIRFAKDTPVDYMYSCMPSIRRYAADGTLENRLEVSPINLPTGTTLDVTRSNLSSRYGIYTFDSNALFSIPVEDGNFYRAYLDNWIPKFKVDASKATSSKYIVCDRYPAMTDIPNTSTFAMNFIHLTSDGTLRFYIKKEEVLAKTSGVTDGPRLQYAFNQITQGITLHYPAATDNQSYTDVWFSTLDGKNRYKAYFNGTERIIDDIAKYNGPVTIKTNYIIVNKVGGET